MEHDVIINGARRGILREERDGLFTVLEATVFNGDELVRLAVYGGGQEGYLGVMQPWNGGLYLRRRLSRRERETLPKTIEYAAPLGEAHGSANDEDEETLTEEETPNHNEADCSAEGNDEVCENHATESEDGEELIWFSRPDGTLTAFDGKRSIIALPTELRRAESGVGTVLREINGRQYMLFRY